MTKRPDLHGLDPVITEYILYLESEIQNLQDQIDAIGDESAPEVQRIVQTFEPPTPLNVITITYGGIAKRTPRHLYSKQRRGGMGVFDLDVPEEDPPAILLIADEDQNLLLFTNLGRAFRLPVAQIEQTDIRAKGKPIDGKIPFLQNEHISAVLPDQAKGALAFLSKEGYVRILRHHIFGEYMRPGTPVLDSNKFGEIISVCWTTGNDELFIASRGGKGIRFSEKIVPPQGCQGIRLESNDLPAAIASVREDSSVFLVDSEGNGTIRLMAGFAANKSAGGSGKIAMKSQEIVSAITVKESSDIFLISNLSKIIRFSANEVPQKEDPVQGVRCMDLRSDKVVSGTCTQ